MSEVLGKFAVNMKKAFGILSWNWGIYYSSYGDI